MKSQCLNESEQGCNILIENLNQTGVPVHVVDKNYNILYANDVLKKKFGIYQNKKCFEYSLRRKSICENCPVKKTILDNNIEKDSLYTPESRDYEIISIPLLNHKGKIDRMLEIIIDIKEKKQAELELAKLKTRIISRYSHELKTPLIHIKGYTDLLIYKFRETFQDEERFLVDQIKKGCNRLETLINTILQKVELKSYKGKIELSRNNLASLIKSCARQLKGLIKLRNHELKLNLDDNLILNFDKEQISHVINNILCNAIKYTPTYGEIEISSQIEGDFAIIAVQDNGIGITEEEKKSLCTKFNKIDYFGQNFDIITEGSGLGLYFTKKILDLHGGKIWIESEGRNKGSTFYFSLPKVKT